MRFPNLQVLACAVLVLAAACDSPSSTPPPETGNLRATVVRGDAQEGTVGQALADTLIVGVTDAQGRPVSNLAVGWTVLTQDGGEPATATAQTDENGRARNFWNLGTKAGIHAMEVRAVLDGRPVILDTLHATARPGAAVTASVSGDTAHVILHPRTVRLLLDGEDQYGNRIPPGEVSATWSTSAPIVAVVAEDGTVTSVSPGRATVTATGNGWVVRAHVTVHGREQAVFATPSTPIGGIHSNGLRTLGAGHAVTVRQDDGWTTEPGVDGLRTMVALRVLPSGTAWGLGLGLSGGMGIWRSMVPGEWNRVSLPHDYNPRFMTSAGEAVFLANGDGLVYRRDGDAWTSLGAPGDGPARQVNTMAAPTADAVYLGGLTQATGGDGAGTAYLVKWEGGEWTRIAMPADFPVRRNNMVMMLAAPRGAGPLYAIVYTMEGIEGEIRSHLVRLSGTVASMVRLPDWAEGVPVTGLALGPDGSPYVSAGNRVMYLQDGVWREQMLVDGWSPLFNPFVDADGIVYTAAERRVNRQQEWAVVELATFLN